jgi:chitin synthase
MAEFETMRYSAVTCDPDDFIRSKYTLRPFLYRRETCMAIVATMYNEDEILFDRTWSSIVKNLAHFNSRSRSKTWGADSWKKVVVVIVSDGAPRAACSAPTAVQCACRSQEDSPKDEAHALAHGLLPRGSVQIAIARFELMNAHDTRRCHEGYCGGP